ncbi:unnamed protein product (macronuclear) [Paramecium tetraurelia]|uniref:MORN repeat protein n=1 Tax=Paramecium tetraurelia TaxID=5888 RepID=A0CEX0_PARTE|nr:uncharacterized protein GSPATT00037776001 [Paramecium tetraurelia]CAK69337.1 unnamed protein product [Paramecium tetraurelia]|eukprot:XP_001436734.1 hypothetical protein (macronuclear) [Paramecium tetraurelia strain d4-2]
MSQNKYNFFLLLNHLLPILIQNELIHSAKSNNLDIYEFEKIHLYVLHTQQSPKVRLKPEWILSIVYNLIDFLLFINTSKQQNLFLYVESEIYCEKKKSTASNQISKILSQIDGCFYNDDLKFLRISFLSNSHFVQQQAMLILYCLIQPLILNEKMQNERQQLDLSVDVYKPTTPQTILKSASPTDRKFSYLSFQRTTIGLESPTKQQDSIYQIEYADDTVYYGQINITKRQGMGAMYDKNKNLIYLGQWNNDKYHGLGILVKDDYTYKGEFVNGILEGQVIEEANQSKFYGYYKNGQKNGPGTLYEQSKTIMGIWKNDVLDQEC